MGSMIGDLLGGLNFGKPATADQAQQAQQDPAQSPSVRL